MNLIEMMERFPTQEACIEFLEGIRYKDGAYCPLCGSVDVARKREKKHTGRWNCHDCKSSFKAVRGTMFHGTKISLQKSAWYMMQRIRTEMGRKENPLLKGIVEMDETYVGGRVRKPNKHGKDDDVPKNPTGGQDDKKTTVIGAVERGGKVSAKMLSQTVNTHAAIEFLRSNVIPVDSTLMTDESSVYNQVKDYIAHEVIRHSDVYVRGEIHTNTIEGFWSLLKRAWYGQHHHYNREFIPLYVSEACWKYNNRKRENAFDHFVMGCFG